MAIAKIAVINAKLILIYSQTALMKRREIIRSHSLQLSKLKHSQVLELIAKFQNQGVLLRFKEKTEIRLILIYFIQDRENKCSVVPQAKFLTEN